MNVAQNGKNANTRCQDADQESGTQSSLSEATAESAGVDGGRCGRRLVQDKRGALRARQNLVPGQANVALMLTRHSQVRLQLGTAGA